MIVLGIDPGYAIVGYGVLRYEKNRFTTLAYGAITTSAGTPAPQRLETVYRGMEQLIAHYRPDAMSVEQLFFQNNQKTGIMVAQARGVILLAAQQKQIPIFEYGPLQVKQSVVGYGKAIKSQVMEMTRVILNLETIPKPDDAADALAIAICHAHTAGSLMGGGGLQAAILRTEQKAARMAGTNARSFVPTSMKPPKAPSAASPKPPKAASPADTKATGKGVTPPEAPPKAPPKKEE